PPPSAYIDVTTQVKRAGVERFGINLAQNNYYDSHQLTKELLHRNPGFEGLLYQSVVRLGPGATATSAIEDAPYTQWPSGFWNGATYEIIWSSGSAKGRTGTVTASLAPLRQSAPNDPNGSAQGTTYVFSDNDAAHTASDGDYMVLRKSITGDSGGGAAFTSWSVTASGGGTVTTESADLPPSTVGLQCARLTADTVGQQAGVTGQFDTTTGFMRLNGQFRVAFRAKGVGGNNRVMVTVRRGSATPYLSQTVQLTTSWADYTLPFSAAESTTVSGAVSVAFSPVSQSAVLLDDVSVRQTDGSVTNPTEFRDDVVDAIKGLNPRLLRWFTFQDLGDSLDNVLAPLFARRRSGYSVYSTNENNLIPGLHEYLVLCEHVGADPWYMMPPSFSPQEAANLMEYLGGDSQTTTYGSLRAQRGHATPWTSVFNRIYLEFSNENWNNTAYRGGAISIATPCGVRADELFAQVKASPVYSSQKFRCVLGGQAANPNLDLNLHNASSQHDIFTLAPYIASRIDDFETGGQLDIEKLFGPLFAEPEWWSLNPSPTSAPMAQVYTSFQSSSRPVPLSVYEVSMHTNSGAITQVGVDAFVPSVGGAIAVAGHMLKMLEELDCRDQNFFSLAGASYSWTASDNTARTSPMWGATIDMGRTNRKRPHYYAQRLLNDALSGDLMVTTQSGDNPTWSINNQNRITFSNAHYIQSYAFINGTQHSLVVFNYHRTSALDVRFTGTNAPTGTVTMQRLTSTNITDNNETSAVVAPTTETLNAFDASQNLSLPPFSMTLLQWTQ
ncbi:MAG: hypothetical protein EB084_12915, partial [Proteobacteria bacterium]|nr:hypothetical protein [Pseudomonadota bacterium]